MDLFIGHYFGRGVQKFIRTRKSNVPQDGIGVHFPYLQLPQKVPRSCYATEWPTNRPYVCICTPENFWLGYISKRRFWHYPRVLLPLCLKWLLCLKRIICTFEIHTCWNYNKKKLWFLACWNVFIFCACRGLAFSFDVFIRGRVLCGK